MSADETAATAGGEGEIGISIALVAYRVRDELDRCLNSIEAALGGLSAEITVVDNSPGMLTWRHLGTRTGVRRLRGSTSLGFGAACNIALDGAVGRYFLILNPDTLLPPDSLRLLAAELDREPEIGIVGPRLVRENGELDPAARRGFPTPWSAFARFARLGRIFPGRRIFGGYNLTHLDPDRRSEVDAVSGAFMLTRSELFRELDGFDRRFWMYGEDLDFAYRAREAGWKVVYQPEVTVLHVKRSSTSQRRLRTRVEFYRAMARFYRKHEARRRPGALNALVMAGIFGLGAGAVLYELVRRGRGSTGSGVAQ